MMQVQIGSIIRPIIIKNLEENETLAEYHYKEPSCILITDDIKVKNTWFRILWHEIVHGLLLEIQENDLNDNEIFVDYMAASIFKFIMDNQDIFYEEENYKRLKTLKLSGINYQVSFKKHLEGTGSSVDHNTYKIKMCRDGCRKNDHVLIESIRCQVDAAAYWFRMVNLDQSFMSRFSHLIYTVLMTNKQLLIDGKTDIELREL